MKRYSSVRKDLLAQVDAERERQLERWGEQHHSAGDWMLILQEEIGEAAQAILQARSEDFKEELIQSAAVIIAWLEDVAKAGVV